MLLTELPSYHTANASKNTLPFSPLSSPFHFLLSLHSPPHPYPSFPYHSFSILKQICQRLCCDHFNMSRRFESLKLPHDIPVSWSAPATCTENFPLASFGEKCDINSYQNKKFELVLKRCVKAYSNSSSQIVLVNLQPFHRNSLLKCALQQKIAKINKTPYFEI